MHSRSIRFQFYTFVIFLLLFMSVLLSFAPLISSRDAVFEEKRNSLTSRGSTAASALSAVGALTNETITDVFSLLDMESYSRVVVTDSNSVVIYDSNGNGGVVADIPDIHSALKSNTTIFRSKFTKDSFDSSFVTPMSNQSEIIGALYLGETDTQQATIIVNVQSRIRLVTIIVCVTTLVLAFIFSHTLLSRFSELVNSMRIVASGDYSHRLAVRGKDEVSALGNEFNEMTNRFQSIETQRQQFVSDASHELKTPIASIKLLSDSIAQSDSMDNSTAREFASDISTAADRLSHITEQLLSLSRLDDDIKLSEEPVDLNQIIFDALSSIKPLAKERNIKIKCSLEDGCVVMGTLDDAYHIVYNLLDNAVKYNFDKGKVDISLHKTADTVVFSVSDTGIGIPESERLNVFTRFYRVDKARSRASGGTGLGLSIVHDAVKAHRGSITIGANKPNGAVFTVTFPRPDDSQLEI